MHLFLCKTSWECSVSISICQRQREWKNCLLSVLNAEHAPKSRRVLVFGLTTPTCPKAHIRNGSAPPEIRKIRSTQAFQCDMSHLSCSWNLCLLSHLHEEYFWPFFKIRVNPVSCRLDWVVCVCVGAVGGRGRGAMPLFGAPQRVLCTPPVCFIRMSLYILFLKRFDERTESPSFDKTCIRRNGSKNTSRIGMWGWWDALGSKTNGKQKIK